MINVVLKPADCNTRWNRPDMALRYCRMAGKALVLPPVFFADLNNPALGTPSQKSV
jgi:hypothetical protein